MTIKKLNTSHIDTSLTLALTLTSKTLRFVYNKGCNKWFYSEGHSYPQV